MQNSPQKILIFGPSGAGKSTFAAELATKTEIPLYHMDKYFFTDNWQKRNNEEFIQMQNDIVTQPRWIIDGWINDGNSIRSLEIRWSKADIVLFFNFPRWLCFLRLIKRRLNPNCNIDDKAGNCVERMTLGLLKYMWSFAKRVKYPIDKLKKQYPDVTFMEIKSKKDLISVKQLLGF